MSSEPAIIRLEVETIHIRNQFKLFTSSLWRDFISLKGKVEEEGWRVEGKREGVEEIG